MNTPRYLQHILRTLLAFFVLIGLSACQNETTLRIGANTWLGYEPLFLARQQQTLPQGVSLHEYPTTAETLRAFRNRNLDVAALTLDEAVPLLLDDNQAAIALVLSHSHGADALLGQPELKHVTDLRGKVVGADSLTLGAYMLGRALELSGMDKKEVQIRSVSLEQQEASFLNREIDGLVTFEPILSRLQRQGAKVLFDSRSLPNEILDVLIVRPQQLNKSQRRQLRELVKVWFEHTETLVTQQDTAMQLVMTRQNLYNNELQHALTLLRFYDREENQRLLAGPDSPQLRRTIDNIAQTLHRLGLRPATTIPPQQPLFTSIGME